MEDVAEAAVNVQAFQRGEIGRGAMQGSDRKPLLKQVTADG